MERLIAYAHEILQGLGTTLTLFIISLVIGFVLAAAVASFQIVFRGPVSRAYGWQCLPYAACRFC